MHVNKQFCQTVDYATHNAIYAVHLAMDTLTYISAWY